MDCEGIDMSRLQDIPVRVEFDLPKELEPDIVSRVLNEIQSALHDLHSNGRTHAIDVRQLPRMSPVTYQALRDALSHGEVSAVVDAQLKVEVAEMQYPGVWWLRYLNEREEIKTEIIEITEMPAILRPHRVEVRAGLQKLTERLQMLASPEALPSLPADQVQEVPVVIERP
jgi:hydrogenase-1 operon protein HyaF